MVANVATKILLALGAADLCALNLLLVPHLGVQGARPIAAPTQQHEPQAPSRPDPQRGPVGPRTDERVEVSAVSLATVAEDPARPSAAAPDVQFSFGSARIGQRAAVADLQGVLRELADDPGRRLLIRGHSDPLGTQAQNLELSWRRAAAVREYLVWRGAARDRIAIEALGDTEPVGGAGPAAWARDRRVELVWR
jgi:outer membrane protein OmpA-like peptidoglycan-associated protein